MGNSNKIICGKLEQVKIAIFTIKLDKIHHRDIRGSLWLHRRLSVVKYETKWSGWFLLKKMTYLKVH